MRLVSKICVLAACHWATPFFAEKGEKEKGKECGSSLRLHAFIYSADIIHFYRTVHVDNCRNYSLKNNNQTMH